MIVENIINIKTNPSNYNHYINKGYYIEKCGCNINVNIQDLPPKSHVKIKCKCEKCDIISEVDYSNYIVQTKNSYYVCSDCWKYKLKETIYNKYGKFKAEIDFSEIFIYPPNKVKATDILITNFHLPESTLLMLISAFWDREKVLSAYQLAIEKDYKFYSFGDSMIFL